MNLKRIRLLADKTQKETAEATNITQFTYSNYENGKTTPDIDTLIKLADYFHTTIDNICGHEVPYLLDRSILSDKQNELIDTIKSLSDEKCQRVLDFLYGIELMEEEKQKIITKYKKGE